MKRKNQMLVLISIASIIGPVSIIAIFPYTIPTSTPATFVTVPPPNFKVAFIGDQSLGPNSVAVLQLIEDEGAQMVLHQGDFEYTNNPNAWDQQINVVL